MSTTLVIGAVDCNDGTTTVLVAMSLGKPSRVAAEYGGPGVDIATLGAVDTSAHVEARFRIRVTGASLDATAAKVAAIADEVRDLATITVGLDGSAYTGTIVPTIGECVEVPLEHPADAELIHAYRTTVDVIVRREAPLYGATDPLFTAEALSVPAVRDLSAMKGQMAAPLDLLLDATTANLHQLVCGVYPDAPHAITKFVLEAVDLTWYATGGGAPAGSAAADANGWPDGVGNTLWKVNTLVGDYTDVDVTDYAGGTYALYANCKRDAGASPATIETTYTDPVTVEGTDLRRQLVGLVSLPCASVRGAATSTLRVTLCGDGTDYVYCNTLEFIPWPFVGWHHATPASSVDKLRFEDDLVYADDVASLAYSIDPTSLITLGGTLVITGEGTAEAPTLAVTATVAYEPRWEQLPSAGGGAGPGI